MKQVNYSRYGAPEVLKITDVAQPRLKGQGKILVKVLYSSLNAIDWKNRKGKFRFLTGWLKPRTKQGFDIVGVIVDKSADVKAFNLHDKIVGQLGNLSGGAMSEYVLMKTNQVVKAPAGIADESLGGLAMAGTTAWQAFFENSKLKAGDKVLINGGSSGVGHLAIQIAKAYGAEVTSVSSGRNVDFCKDLGADFTVDYTREDFTRLKKQFGIIFDVVFTSTLGQVRDILKPNGIYIGTTPTPRLLKDTILTKNAQFVAVKPNPSALTDLCRLMEDDLLRVHIDKMYPLDQIADAHRYMQKSRTRGKLIVKVSE